jgi:hypothetical protein
MTKKNKTQWRVSSTTHEWNRATRKWAPKSEARMHPSIRRFKMTAFARTKKQAIAIARRHPGRCYVDAKFNRGPSGKELPLAKNEVAIRKTIKNYLFENGVLKKECTRHGQYRYVEVTVYVKNPDGSMFRKGRQTLV